MPVPDLYTLFVQPLEQAGFTYMVTGSVAAIMYGEPRLTHDVDMVMVVNPQQAAELPLIFREPEYYCPPAEVIRIESRRDSSGHFNLIHIRSGLKADCYPDNGDPLHAWGLEHRRRMRMPGNGGIWMAPPEYVVIRKLEYYRDGRSEKHIGDIRSMVHEVRHEFDDGFLHAELKRRGLGQFWNELIEPY